MTVTRASTTAVAAVVGGVLVLLVLVTWAAGIGPSGVLTGEGPQPDRVNSAGASASDVPSASATLDHQQRLAERYEGDRPLLRALALVLEVAAALLVLFGLYRGARWAWQTYDARRRPPPAPDDLDFDVLDSPDVLAGEIVSDARAQRALLASGTPRNAVVEAWRRFETQAGAAGVVRRPWETSSEFTLRVLELVEADSAAVSLLAGLYREARFSDHELTEDDRVSARAALDAVHASLATRLGRTR